MPTIRSSSANAASSPGRSGRRPWPDALAPVGIDGADARPPPAGALRCSGGATGPDSSSPGSSPPSPRPSADPASDSDPSDSGPSDSDPSESDPSDSELSDSNPSDSGFSVRAFSLSTVSPKAVSESPSKYPASSSNAESLSAPGSGPGPDAGRGAAAPGAPACRGRCNGGAGASSSAGSTPSSAAIAASRAEVSMKPGSTRCTARYSDTAAALRPPPSYARANQYRSSLRCGCSERQRASEVANGSSAWPHMSSRTRAIPPNSPASMPSSGSSSSVSVSRISCSQSFSRYDRQACRKRTERSWSTGGQSVSARSSSGRWRPSSQCEACARARSLASSRIGCTHQPSQYQELSGRRWRRRCSPKRSRLRCMASSAAEVSERSACRPSQASAIPGSIRTAARNSSSARVYAPAA